LRAPDGIVAPACGELVVFSLLTTTRSPPFLEDCFGLADDLARLGFGELRQLVTRNRQEIAATQFQT
jgi:hypothetical protein